MRALIEGKADVNARAGDGGTALHVAAAHLQRESARLLLDCGADRSIRTEPEDPGPEDGDSDDLSERPSDERADSGPPPAQYGGGLTAAGVATATRDAATLAQEAVEYSLEGFSTAGQMKNELDLAEALADQLALPRSSAGSSSSSSSSGSDGESSEDGDQDGEGQDGAPGS